MSSSHTLLYVTFFVFGFCFANIPLNQVQFKVFDNNRTHLFELMIENSLKSTKKFLANKVVANVIANDQISTPNAVIPFVGQLTSLTSVLTNLFAENGHWMNSFKQTIANDSRRDLILYDIHSMQATVEIIENQLALLSSTSNKHIVHQKQLVSLVYSDLDRLIDFFAHHYSVFKPYPLVGAPALIELSLLVAIFTPIAKILTPLEVKHPQIACKMLDTLLDYRPRTISARLALLRSNDTHLIKILAAVQQIPYNADLNNKTTTLQCDKINGIRSSSSKNNGLWDELGVDNDLYVPSSHSRLCFFEYVQHVRHRVEEMFPIPLLEKVCNDPKARIVTGMSEFFD